MTEDLCFPIGEFDMNFEVSTAARLGRIQVIRELPLLLSRAIASLSETQLDTRYRPDGWTVRQTVHHLADSHANSLIRFKLALTEDEPPTIKPYFQERWAELADTVLPPDISLRMLEAIHTRWVTLLEAMTDADFAKQYIHPHTGKWTLEGALALYAWHSKHHTAHITRLRDRMGW